MYIGYDNREYEDPEMDAMRADAQQDRQEFRQLVQRILDEQNALGQFFTVSRMKLWLMDHHQITVAPHELESAMEWVTQQRIAARIAAQDRQDAQDELDRQDELAAQDARKEWEDAY